MKKKRAVKQGAWAVMDIESGLIAQWGTNGAEQFDIFKNRKAARAMCEQWIGTEGKFYRVVRVEFRIVR